MSEVNPPLCLFDSHAHYTDPAFDNDRAELLAGFPAYGICGCMTPSTDLASAAEAIALAERFPFLVTAVGVHPECTNPPDDYLSTLQTLAQAPSVKAIGEIGLDYHYEGYDPVVQKRLLCEQLALAKDLQLPVILHSRDALADMMELLRYYRPTGVMHCFPGSAEVAQEVQKLGLYIGFTGVITFQNARKPLAALRAVSPDRLLLETDCPYMAPVPYRSKRCDSTMLPATVAVMAREHQVSAAWMSRQTAENAATFFHCESLLPATSTTLA